MAVVLRMLYNELHYYIVDCKDTRLENYFLLGSPLKIFSIVGLYLYFVYEWGPKFMKERKAYELKYTLLVYNLIQVVANLAFGIFGIKAIYDHIGQLDCVPVNYGSDKRGMMSAYASYAYYMLKVSDLLDTVFFILRKKYNQVTFLHVYHHSIMCIGTYIYTHYIAGGQYMYLPFVNSWVHAVMYFYYFLTAFKPELKASIWWKKYITQFQLVQFASVIIMFSRPLIQHTRETCNLSRFWLFFGIIQNGFMFAMFSEFYYKTYINKAKKEAKQIKEKQF